MGNARGMILMVSFPVFDLECWGRWIADLWCYCLDDDNADEENAASVHALGSGMAVLSAVAIVGGFML